MIKKPKKSNQTKKRQRIIKDCTKIWEELVIAERGNKCELCGKPIHSVHHFIRKSQAGHLRFYIPLGIITCFHCHSVVVETPLGIQQLRDQRGEDWYWDIINKAKNKPKNFKTSMKWFKDELERLKGLDKS